MRIQFVADIINLAEVQAFAEEQVLLTPDNAQMSSTYSQNHAAEKCIDGSLASFCHTDGRSTEGSQDLDPWLRIDYGKSVDIKEIVVSNRIDSNEGVKRRIVGATISITTDADGTDVVWCDTFKAAQDVFRFVVDDVPTTSCSTRDWGVLGTEADCRAVVASLNDLAGYVMLGCRIQDDFHLIDGCNTKSIETLKKIDPNFQLSCYDDYFFGGHGNTAAKCEAASASINGFLNPKRIDYRTTCTASQCWPAEVQTSPGGTEVYYKLKHSTFSKRDSRAGGGCSSDPEGYWGSRTDWTALRIDLATLRASKIDRQESVQTSGAFGMDLGSAADCVGSGSTAGESIIDLRGSPFAIAMPNDTVAAACEASGSWSGGHGRCFQWISVGFNAKMIITCSENNQRCIAKCGGYTGNCWIDKSELYLTLLPSADFANVANMCGLGQKGVPNLLSGQPPHWHESGSHKYAYFTSNKVHPQATSWHDARKACNVIGADLVSIDNEDEHKFIASIVTKHGVGGSRRIWTGCTLIGGNNVYEKMANVGTYGGECTCPDGQVYKVGDNRDHCGSLACIGGAITKACSSGGIPGSAAGMGVICGSVDDNTTAKWIWTATGESCMKADKSSKFTNWHKDHPYTPYRGDHGCTAMDVRTDLSKHLEESTWFEWPCDNSIHLDVTADYVCEFTPTTTTTSATTTTTATTTTKTTTTTTSTTAAPKTDWITEPSTGAKYWVNPKKIRWEDAEAHCQAVGGSLANIDSQVQFGFLSSLIGAAESGMWIGCNDRVEEGTFVWTDGTSCSKYVVEATTTVPSTPPTDKGTDVEGCLVKESGTYVWIVHSDKTRNWIGSPTSACKSKAAVVPDIEVYPKRYNGAGRYTLDAVQSAAACAKTACGTNDNGGIDGVPAGDGGGGDTISLATPWYSFWGSNEPNQQGNEDCVEFRSGTDRSAFYWNDLPCSLARASICQLKDTESTISTTGTSTSTTNTTGTGGTTSTNPSTRTSTTAALQVEGDAEQSNVQKLKTTLMIGIALGACALVAIVVLVLFCCCKNREPSTAGKRAKQAVAAGRRVSKRGQGARPRGNRGHSTQNPAFNAGESVSLPEGSGATFDEEAYEGLEPVHPVEEFAAVDHALNPTTPAYAAIDENDGGAVAPVALYLESNPNQPRVYDDAKTKPKPKKSAGSKVAATAAFYLEPISSQPEVYDDAKKKSPKRETKRGRGKGGPRCARGEESGGKACNHPPVQGSRFCDNHKCEHADCRKSKSSGDDFCVDHLPAGVRPRATTLARGATLQLLQGVHGEAPAQYDVLEPGYMYSDLKGAQQQYGSKPVAVRACAADYTGFNDAFDVVDESDDDLEV